ncbi:hypothetical protein [Paenibacillus sp. 1P03SA]|uniref:hypothetical protein n=1 Tax=Paenibacillus sp. 1P03SA TaxID=3132294 RepID=UPI00399F93FB
MMNALENQLRCKLLEYLETHRLKARELHERLKSRHDPEEALEFEHLLGAFHACHKMLHAFDLDKWKDNAAESAARMVHFARSENIDSGEVVRGLRLVGASEMYETMIHSAEALGLTS